MPTLGQVVCALEERLFVGREAELAEFDEWLREPSAAPQILNVCGLGGVGKSALLHAFNRAARALGRPVLVADPPDMPALLEQGARDSCSLLLLDGIDDTSRPGQLFRAALLDGLDSGAHLVIATRRPLSQIWSHDDVWHMIVRPMPLTGLTPGDARLYLERRGVSTHMAVSEQILTITQGHPLALSLAADLVVHRGIVSLEDAPEWRLVTRSLVESMLDHVDEPVRELLEAAALLRQFDEPTLLAVAGRPANPAAFALLCNLSIIQPTLHGLTLHNEVRNILLEDLRWRNPARYQALRQRATQYYRERIAQAAPRERARLMCDRLYLSDHQPLHSVLFGDWRSEYLPIECGVAVERDAVREEFASTDNGRPNNCESAFLRSVLEQPQAELCVARTKRGRLAGFTATLPLSLASLLLLRHQPRLAEIASQYLGVTPSRVRSGPTAKNVFYHVHVVVDSYPVGPTVAALLRGSIGVLAEGGVHLAVTPASAARNVLAPLGFEPLLSADGRGDNSRLQNLYVLDLTRSGVDPWLDAVVAGEHVSTAEERSTLERELRAALPHWADDGWLRRSALWDATALSTAIPGRSPSALRKTVEVLVNRLVNDADSQDQLAYRALKLAYFTPRITHEAAAERLAVSRATFYRLLERSVRGLAQAMRSASAWEYPASETA